jgi:DNA-binding transcriptional regulator YhcF (GntR family)
MNFKENKPIYLQVADVIADDIVSGKYPENGRIPSVRDFAVALEVNANTVVHSYDYLQSNEIVYNRRGLGYFVTVGARNRILEIRRKAFLDEDIRIFFRSIDTLGISLNDIETLYNKYQSENNHHENNK